MFSKFPPQDIGLNPVRKHFGEGVCVSVCMCLKEKRTFSFVYCVAFIFKKWQKSESKKKDQQKI